MTAQLPHESALGRSEDRAEQLVPLVPHQLEESGHVPFGHRPVTDQRVLGEGSQHIRVHPLRLEGAVQLSLDDRPEPRLQQFEGLADPFVVGDCHVAGSLPQSVVHHPQEFGRDRLVRQLTSRDFQPLPADPAGCS